MLHQLARNAIFVLFPLLLAAIVFLGRLNLQATQSFGKWGERSIVESTFLVAAEKVDRVEQEIIAEDNFQFRIINPANLARACDAWQDNTRGDLIEAAAIFDDADEIVAFYHRRKDAAGALELYRLLETEIIPNTNLYDSMDQHKHYHWLLGTTYYMVTTFTTEFEGRIYTSLLLYNTAEITGRFFEKVMRDVGQGRVVNVVDDNGTRIFGDDFSEAGDFSVAKRFPTTLYKWKLQMAPVSAALFETKAQHAALSSWILIPASFFVIVFSVLILVTFWMRERRLNKLKSDFISNTSHELKTPLALIRMFSELLAMKQVKDPEKVARYHDIILKETERLTALIDNVLDFAKIERGGDVYHFESFQPADVVAGAFDIYRHRVEAMGATLTLKIEDNLPDIVADRDAFTLVLLNLVDNAIKYAIGTDVIGVELYTRNRQLFLDVYDRGQGIPAPHLKRIFERFYRYRGPGEDASRQRGSGIGLSLVKHIARAHGGGVTVTSTPGVETCFSVRFPLK